MSFSKTFNPRKPSRPPTSQLLPTRPTGTPLTLPSSDRSSAAPSTPFQPSPTSTPTPSRPAGTPLSLPASQPSGAPIGLPSATLGAPIGLPGAPPSKPAGTPIGLPGAPPTRPSGTPLALPGAPAATAQPSISVGSGIRIQEIVVPIVRAGLGDNGTLRYQPSQERHEVPVGSTGEPEATDQGKGNGRKRIAPEAAPEAEPRAKKARHATYVGSGTGTSEPAALETHEGVDAVEAGGRKRSARIAQRRGAAPEGTGTAGTTEEDEEEDTSANVDAREPETEPEATGKKGRGKKRQAKARKRKLDILHADANGLMPGDEGYDPVTGGGPATSGEAGVEEEGESSALVPAKRARRRSPSPSMLAADPGAPLDVNTTLMSDILRDPGVGKLSNRFVEAYRAKRKLNEERRKERERRREEMVRRKRELEEAVERGEGRALGAKAAEDDGEGEQHAGEGPQDAVAVRAAVVNALRAAEEPTPPPEDGPFRETHTAPQLRMGAHGEWEIDEDLLLIDRAADPALQQEEELEEVEERESDRFVTSFTWSKLEKNPGARARWSREETELLCKGIGWFGYDFEMISKLFVGRDRLSVKRRWKNVEKVDPARAQAAWENREPIDLSYFSKHIGTNLLLPAAPIQPPMLALPPSTPPPDETPVLRLPAPKAARGEPEEEIFDMDVGEETYEEIDLDEEELPTLSEAMMV